MITHQKVAIKAKNDNNEPTMADALIRIDECKRILKALRK
jgi:hypothetical protein